MKSFNGQICIVTGGASGIGKEICTYLGSHGATVIIADIDGAQMERTSREIQSSGGRCRTKLVDIGDQAGVENLVAETVEEFGRLDLIINNAGIGLDGELADASHQQFKRVMDINFWGVYYGTTSAYPVMIQQGYGQIVNVSSLAGLLPGGLMTSYVASKHAVTGFTLALRPEARQYGVQVNLLCPGFLETEIHGKTEKVTEYLKTQAEERKRTRFPTAAKCVRSMMKGIAQNKAIIISPWGQRIYWWMYRWFPSFLPWMWYKIIVKMRRDHQKNSGEK